jgi:hypothetical protein
MLWRENLASIHARYPDTVASGDYPGPANFRARDVDFYLFQDVPGTVDPLAVIDAVSCYEYQSCEHAGWQASEAKAFCDALTAKMLRQIPRKASVWEISDRNVFRKLERVTA